MKNETLINIHGHINPGEILDEKIRHYQNPGIARTWISSPVGDNDIIRKAMVAYPSFVVGLGMVRLGSDTPHIVDALYHQGFRGLKITRPLKRYDDPEFFPIYEKAQDYRMPILFHTGYVAHREEFPDVVLDRMSPICLDTIARHFPELKIIGAHLGNPWCQEACLVASKHRNIYFDLSGATLRTKPLAFFQGLFIRASGEDLTSLDAVTDQALFRKLVFGTDNAAPAGLYIFYRNLMEALDIEIDIRRQVFFRNAEKILGL